MLNLRNGILMTIVSLSLNGCQTEELERESNHVTSSDMEVSFKSRILSRVVNNRWEEKDNIGVFMLKANSSLSDETVINNAINMKYTYHAQEQTFSPATENDRMYYPAKAAVDFIAYYPYKAVSDYRLSMDITGQQNQSIIDLLYSNNLKNLQATERPQTLQFEHRFSRLIFNIRAGEGIKKEDLKSVNVLVKDIPVQATINLSDAQITPNETSRKDITACINDTTAYAIVYPGSSRGKHISVVLPSGEFTFQISGEAEDWAPGYQYDYTLVLNRNINTPILNAQISPWKDGTGEELENNENDVTVIPWDGQASDITWYTPEEDEFILTNANELNGLSELVNAGNTFDGKTIRMARDINLNNHPFPTIGNNTHAFEGTFDGDHHQITGYQPQLSETQPFVSLFGANKGIIRNLILTGSGSIENTTHPSVFVGAIAGDNQHTIEGCRSYVEIKLTSTLETEATLCLGGIAGVNQGNINNCQNYGVMAYTGTADRQTQVYMGGITGLLKNGNIEQCENNQNLIAAGTTVALGGICGNRDSGTTNTEKVTAAIRTCNNYGNIQINETKGKGYAGGIIGRTNDWTSLSACTNQGNISSAALQKEHYAYAGGIAGRAARCTFHDCHNSGKTHGSNTVNEEFAYSGGIVSYLSTDSKVHTSTQAAEASAESNKYQGGIVGCVDKKNNNIIVYGCNQNQGSPKKWIGSATGSNYKAGVTTTPHEDE